MALKRLAPRRVKLGTALIALLLLAVLSTALVIHLSWSWTARRNIESVVASLNGQTADAVRSELDHTFCAAEGAAEIVRSILFQATISADDEAKREFVFLSVLRSDPALSWVGFGFPDGRFFGSHATAESTIEMVEIGAPYGSGGRTLRRDTYVASSMRGEQNMGRLDSRPGPMAEAMTKLLASKEADALIDTKIAGPVYGTAAGLDFNGWQLLTAIPR